jgi:hypothetical protein
MQENLVKRLMADNEGKTNLFYILLLFILTILDPLVLLGRQGHLDLQVMLVKLVRQVQQASSMKFLALMERLAMLAHQALQGHQASLALMEKQDRMVNPGLLEK